MNCFVSAFYFCLELFFLLSFTLSICVSIFTGYFSVILTVVFSFSGCPTFTELFVSGPIFLSRTFLTCLVQLTLIFSTELSVSEPFLLYGGGSKKFWRWEFFNRTLCIYIPFFQLYSL